MIFLINNKHCSNNVMKISFCLTSVFMIMKKLFRDTFLVFSLLIPLSSAKIYNEDYSKSKKLNLFKENKVWMVYGWTFPNENGLKVKKGKKVSFERFDRNGNRIEEVNYDMQGNTIYSCKYFFDKNGNEIQRIGIADGEEIDEKSEYVTVDENGIENTPEYKNTVKHTSLHSNGKHQNETEENYSNKKEKFNSCEMFNDKEEMQTDEYSVNEKNNVSL